MSLKFFYWSVLKLQGVFSRYAKLFPKLPIKGEAIRLDLPCHQLPRILKHSDTASALNHQQSDYYLDISLSKLQYLIEEVYDRLTNNEEPKKILFLGELGGAN